MLQALVAQLIKDLKASWQKSAALGVLLLVGLCFWIPPLLRGAGGSPAVVETAVVPPAASTSNPEATATNADSSAVAGSATELTWEQNVAALQSSANLQSVELDSIQGDPFHTDYDQFSPPVLFEESEIAPAKPKAVAAAPTGPVVAPPGMVLNSTIVGFKRRAALINSRMYYEGKPLKFEGRTYTLTSVLPRKVVLSSEAGVFELQITQLSAEPGER